MSEEDGFSVGEIKSTTMPTLDCEICNQPTILDEMTGWSIPFDDDSGQLQVREMLVCSTCFETQEQMDDEEVSTLFESRLKLVK
jgi:hypothetical protein